MTRPPAAMPRRVARGALELTVQTAERLGAGSRILAWQLLRAVPRRVIPGARRAATGVGGSLAGFVTGADTLKERALRVGCLGLSGAVLVSVAMTAVPALCLSSGQAAAWAALAAVAAIAALLSPSLGCAVIGTLACAAAGTWLLWLALPIWTIAAWRLGMPEPRARREAGRIPAVQPSPAPADGSPLDSRDAFLKLLEDLTGSHPGVHLSDIAQALKIHPRQVRPLCDRWGVPITRGVKVRGRGRPGVHRTALKAARAASPQPGSTTPSGQVAG